MNIDRIDCVLTGDGSSTLYHPDFNEHYHSLHGAVQESRHVFIDAGLTHRLAAENARRKIRIFEMGFGTGLNVLLTSLYAQKCSVEYVTVDTQPLSTTQIEALNYPSMLGDSSEEIFRRIHAAPWDERVEIRPDFCLMKYNVRLQDFSPSEPFDLIYYDAFSPEKQPELWTEDMFRRIFIWCAPGAVLVTYCAKGAVRRALMAAGFSVERLPGPPGKREMLRSVKKSV